MIFYFLKTMTSPSLLTVSDLTIQLKKGKKWYSVVDHVSFTLQKGKTLAIVGESGCGKTLTSLSILRILPEVAKIESSSRIFYHGVSLTDLSEKEMRKIRGKKIAMIFQDPMTALNPVYTIGSQLLEITELHLNLPMQEGVERVLQSLYEVGISANIDFLDVYPHQISGGMKQRVMIAMALLCEPDLLIADEPTTALDVTIQAQILELITSLQKEKQMALLLITHDMGVVAEMADDVHVMYAGEIIEKGSSDDIFYSPSHPYTQGLFHSLINPKNPKDKLKPIKGMVPAFTKWPIGCRFHPRCPFVMEKCKRTEVPNFMIHEKHPCRCFLYDGSEESLLQLKEPSS